MSEVDQVRQMAGVVATLHREFPEELEVTLSARVRQAFAEFEVAPVRDFVPILAARQVRSSLRGHAAPAPRAG